MECRVDSNAGLGGTANTEGQSKHRNTETRGRQEEHTETGMKHSNCKYNKLRTKTVSKLRNTAGIQNTSHTETGAVIYRNVYTYRI